MLNKQFFPFVTNETNIKDPCRQVVCKYKAALSGAYGAGLRVFEVVAVKLPDIDSQRMLIRVEQGKGRKDRYVMLSPQLLRWPSEATPI